MPPIRVNALVRLKEDVPEPRLSRGDEGVVQSVWLSSNGFFCEVEFRNNGSPGAVRTLLLAEQLEVVP